MRMYRTISLDLGLTTSIDIVLHGEQLATLDCFVRFADGQGVALLSVIRFDAPDWFEPYTRRLAINDLRWVDFSIPRNDPVDLDPWSKAVIEATKGRLPMWKRRRG